MRPIRKLSLALLGIALSLFVVEVGLQIWAYVVWQRGHAAVATVEPREGVPSVLCVGDSYTFGLGAQEVRRESYPARLQELIDAGTLPPHRVVTEAWPSRNSGEVLAKIGGQLERVGPRRVYVLCGANDIWRPPEAQAPKAQATESGFPVVWRTRRLLRLALRSWAGEEPSRPMAASGSLVGDAAGFVGTWVNDGAEVVITDSGVVLAPPFALKWRRTDDADVLHLHDPRMPSTSEMLLRWRLVDVDTLELQWPGQDAPRKLKRGVTVPNQLEHASTMLEFWAAEARGENVAGSRGSPEDEDRNNRKIDQRARALGSARVSEIQDVTIANLGAIAALCRGVGADPVFLAYPCGMKCMLGVAERAGEAFDVPVIDLLPPLQRAAATIPIEDLFIPDGHCTALGYRKVAEVVYTDLERALRGY